MVKGGVMIAAAMLAAIPITADELPRIATVQVYQEASRYLPPVITLGSGRGLVAIFDTMGPEQCYLRYSLTHCDAQWQPSRISEVEYSSSFNEGRVDDLSPSQGTLGQYVNYRISLPNDEVVPLISGNYLLNIYDEDSPDSILVRIPFGVSEGSARVAASVTSRTDYDYNGAHQQLEITVNFDGMDIADPWNDLRVVVTQNGRRTDSRIVSRALRVNGKTATFAHSPALTWTAGKEYRRFETVSTERYLPMGVELVAYEEPWYHFKLYDDLPRSGRDYVYDRTQHGAYTPAADGTNDPDTEAEYVKVHFTLDFPEQPEADIVIEGDLTERRTDSGSTGVMHYDRVSQRYEAVLTLKQGSYNYQYVVVPHNGDHRPLTAPIEGDDYRTNNRYDISVYYCPPGGRYDRLIGHTSVFANE